MHQVRVLIAACDTFRAGAVEQVIAWPSRVLSLQLRTHVRKLSALYPQTPAPIAIYERGYGKDDAEIAQQAITFGASGRLAASWP